MAEMGLLRVQMLMTGVRRWVDEVSECSAPRAPPWRGGRSPGGCLSRRMHSLQGAACLVTWLGDHITAHSLMTCRADSPPVETFEWR